MGWEELLPKEETKLNEDNKGKYSSKYKSLNWNLVKYLLHPSPQKIRSRRRWKVNWSFEFQFKSKKENSFNSYPNQFGLLNTNKHTNL